MSFTVTRVAIAIGAVALLGAGVTVGYIAVIAARRSEGVFVPAGYVAIACLVAGTLLARVVLRTP
ncbi:MAG: hypothetical protein ABJE10_02480 [bacterium]